MRPVKPALFALASVAMLFAQEPVFKSGVELVTVPVNVAGRDGATGIGGLTLEDFRLFEDGVAQTLAYARRERQSLSVSFVLDTSGSMREYDRIDLAIAALREAIVNVDANDEVAIVSAGKAGRELLPWSAPLRAAGSKLDIRIEDNRSLNSAIFDGLAIGLGQMKRAKNQRRAIVVISDGLENSSRAGLRDIITTREQSETAVYAFHLSAGRSTGSEINVLPSLVGDSGGAVFRIQNSDQVNTAVKGLIDDLRNQYTLAYAPLKAFDGKYRRIKVESTRGGVTLRHRGGYLAVANAGGK